MDEAYSLAVDGSGAVYVTGWTESSDFPTTAGSYDQTHNGMSDVFITKLNSSGSALVWSTFLGGSNNDYGYSLAVDESGAVYVTGYTYSSDFPTTAGSYDQTHNGPEDVFVSKFCFSPSISLLSGSGTDNRRYV